VGGAVAASRGPHALRGGGGSHPRRARAHEADDQYVFRFVEATDPLGGTERVEFRWNDTAEIPVTDTVVPTGFEAANANLNDFNTLSWDKLAWSRGPGQIATATITKWLTKPELPLGAAFSTPTPHSVKRPLERRVWYQYPGQYDILLGWWVQPSRVGRVFDDGSSQIWTAEYNGQGRVTKQIDPLVGAFLLIRLSVFGRPRMVLGLTDSSSSVTVRVAAAVLALMASLTSVRLLRGRSSYSAVLLPTAGYTLVL
jgi:YD repeat-containing protein